MTSYELTSKAAELFGSDTSAATQAEIQDLLDYYADNDLIESHKTLEVRGEDLVMVCGDGSEVLIGSAIMDEPARITTDDGTQIIVTEKENGMYYIELILSNGFETEQHGPYTNYTTAEIAGKKWAQEDWSDYL